MVFFEASQECFLRNVKTLCEIGKIVMVPADEYNQNSVYMRLFWEHKVLGIIFIRYVINGYIMVQTWGSLK